MLQILYIFLQNSSCLDAQAGFLSDALVRRAPLQVPHGPAIPVAMTDADGHDDRFQLFTTGT